MEFCWGSVGDDFALVDDHCAGAGGIDLFKDVGGEEDGLGFAETFDELADFVFLVGVESVGRFVKNQYLGVVEECLGEAGAVAVSFREGIDGLVGHAAEKAGLDCAVDGVCAVAAAEPADIGAEFEESDHRHVEVERGGFREVANVGFGFLRVRCHGHAADLGIASCWWDESCDHAHGGGFASAVGPQKSEHLAFFHGEGQVIDGDFLSELFLQVYDFDHGLSVGVEEFAAL